MSLPLLVAVCPVAFLGLSPCQGGYCVFPTTCRIFCIWCPLGAYPVPTVSVAHRVYGLVHVLGGVILRVDQVAESELARKVLCLKGRTGKVVVQVLPKAEGVVE